MLTSTIRSRAGGGTPFGRLKTTTRANENSYPHPRRPLHKLYKATRVVFGRKLARVVLESLELESSAQADRPLPREAVGLHKVRVWRAGPWICQASDRLGGARSIH